MRKSILVVDDDIFIRNTTHHILGVDFNIFLAKNINRARDFVVQKEIDLIILDIQLKNENSKELLVEFRNNKSTENIPIIVFTSNTDQSIKNDYYSLGIVDYINKPYNFHDLENKVNNAFYIVEKKKNKRENTWHKALKSIGLFF